LRGIILAGGTGQRLDPLTRITNKHLLPVYDRPMIYYAIEQMAGAGLDRIMIVTGGNHAGEFLRLLGNGSRFGLRHLDYAYQDKAGGIADALGLAEYFAGGEPVAVLLGDNIFEFSIAGAVRRFRADPRGARVVLAQVDNPGAYGVAEERDGKLVRIIEKPKNPPSSLVVTGLYLYDPRVFDMVKTLKPSGRGELEITDVNNNYLRLGEMRHEQLEGYWADCGESFDMLLRANNLVAERGANKPRP
jgi:glucose-1-phosphate thymidylyltransferase